MSSIHSLLSAIGLISLAVAAGYALLALLAVLVWQLARRAEAAAEAAAGDGVETAVRRGARACTRTCAPSASRTIRSSRSSSASATATIRRLRVVQRLMAEFPAAADRCGHRPAAARRQPQGQQSHQHAGRARATTCWSWPIATPTSDRTISTTVTAPLLDRKVGLVTCIYHGEPTPRIWSRLGAMYVNEWYMPSVLLARLFGHEGYASGQTLCMRRETLQGIGGLRAIADHLADDYRLGELIRGLGLRIVLSPYVLRAEHHEPTLDLLVRHEVRWMRTLRILRPRSFGLIFFGFSLPLAVLGLLLVRGRGLALDAGLDAVRGHAGGARRVAFRAPPARRAAAAGGFLAASGARSVAVLGLVAYLFHLAHHLAG